MAEWVSGSGITGFSDSAGDAAPANTRSSSYDLSEIERFRQGVEINSQHSFFVGTQPKIWSGARDRFGNPSHILLRTSYGAGTSFVAFSNSVACADTQKFTVEEYVTLGNSYPRPIVLNGGSGVGEAASIEPLTIPFKKATNDIPGREAHILRGTVPSVPHNKTTYDVSTFTALDQGQRFVGDTLEGSVMLPGYVSPNTPTMPGFTDCLRKDDYTSKISSTDNSFIDAINSMSSTNDSGFGKSSTSGRDVYGLSTKSSNKTDSVAFSLLNRGNAKSRLGLRGSGTRSTPALVQAKEPKVNLNTTIRKVASDNRTGGYALFYDDTTTPTIGVSQLVNLPTGLTSGSVWLKEEETTEIYVSSSLLQQSYDNRAQKHNQLSQSYVGYKDSGNHASEAKASSNPSTFFSVGSNITGFKQPLWDKSKIEIDLSVGSEISWGQRNAVGEVEAYMAYYDHSAKTFVPISNVPSAEFALSPDPVYNFLSGAAIAFSPGIKNAPFDVELPTIATLMSNFGFPASSKYKVAKNSPILYPLSGVLSEPFVLEKVVLEFTGSYSQTGVDPTGLNFAVSTFFILNQKLGGYDQPTRFTTKNLTNSALDIDVDNPVDPKRLEFITKLQISAISPGASDLVKEKVGRDLTILDDPTNGWSGRFVVSGACVCPGRNDGITDFEMWVTGPTIYQWLATNTYGGRNGKFAPCGRNFLQAVPTSEIVGGKILGLHEISYNKEEFTVNPYILMPTDNLVFGWQIPFLPELQPARWVVTTEGPSLTFAPGVAKVVLYGSYLKNSVEREERHDTLNQLYSGIVEERIILK